MGVDNLLCYPVLITKAHCRVLCQYSATTMSTLHQKIQARQLRYKYIKYIMLANIDPATVEVSLSKNFPYKSKNKLGIFVNIYLHFTLCVEEKL